MEQAINLRGVPLGGTHAARLYKPDIQRITSYESILIRRSGTKYIDAGAGCLVGKGAIDLDQMIIRPKQVMEIVQSKKCREDLKKSGLRTRCDNLYDPDIEETLNAIFGKLLFPLPEFFVKHYKCPGLHEAAVSSIKVLLECNLDAVKRFNQTRKDLLSIQDLDASGIFLSFRDLKGIDLSNADLTGAFLTGANLENSNCGHTNFTNAHLAGSVLRNSVLACAFYGADLRGADLSGSELNGSFFAKAKLRNANLSNCDLTGFDFGWMDLREAVLTGTSLDNVGLNYTDLREADLSGIDLFGANLETAYLNGARISYWNREFLTNTVLRKNPDIDWVL